MFLVPRWSPDRPHSHDSANKIDNALFGPKDRVGIVIELMDWSGAHEPSSDVLAGRDILFQARSRFDAIRKNGGQILGLRPLWTASSQWTRWTSWADVATDQGFFRFVLPLGDQGSEGLAIRHLISFEWN